MKVDLKDLRKHLEGEIRSFERRIAALQDQIRQVEAVQRIAERVEKGGSSSEPVEKAMEELKRSNGKEGDVEEEAKQAFAEAKKADSTDKEFDWAFQSGEK
jgi:hypothetical protein